MPNRLPDPAGGLQPSTLTTTGDILYASSAQVAARLGIGSTNQVLGVTSGVPAYQASSKSTLTTTGDILYASAANTPARLGIGSSGQSLVVASGIPSWATPSSGSVTFLQKSTFSAVANTGTTFDSLFTSAYDSYDIHFYGILAATDTDDFHFQFRYAGPTTQTASYYWEESQITSGAQVLVSSAGAGAAHILVAPETGTSTYGLSGRLTIDKLLSTAVRPSWQWQVYCADSQKWTGGAGYQDVSRIYTGFLLKSSSSNISGTVVIYGRKNS